MYRYALRWHTEHFVVSEAGFLGEMDKIQQAQ
jgi:hypothetical protein